MSPLLQRLHVLYQGTEAVETAHEETDGGGGGKRKQLQGGDGSSTSLKRHVSNRLQSFST